MAAAAVLGAAITFIVTPGLYDEIDPQWIVPHFEKMLYDNAQLAELYT